MQLALPVAFTKHSLTFDGSNRAGKQGIKEAENATADIKF